MPILDGSLKGQIFEIESRMSKRVEEVFNYYDSHKLVDYPAKLMLDKMLLLYENTIEAMKQDIVAPFDGPNDPHMQPNMMQSTDIVKRLNKGYLRFVYETSPTRMQEVIEENKAREELNNEKAQEDAEIAEFLKSDEESTSNAAPELPVVPANNFSIP